MPGMLQPDECMNADLFMCPDRFIDVGAHPFILCFMTFNQSSEQKAIRREILAHNHMSITRSNNEISIYRPRTSYGVYRDLSSV